MAEVQREGGWDGGREGGKEAEGDNADDVEEEEEEEEEEGGQLDEVREEEVEQTLFDQIVGGGSKEMRKKDFGRWLGELGLNLGDDEEKKLFGYCILNVDDLSLRRERAVQWYISYLLGKGEAEVTESKGRSSGGGREGGGEGGEGMVSLGLSVLTHHLTPGMPCYVCLCRQDGCEPDCECPCDNFRRARPSECPCGASCPWFCPSQRAVPTPWLKGLATRLELHPITIELALGRDRNAVLSGDVEKIKASAHAAQSDGGTYVSPSIPTFPLFLSCLYV